MIDMKSDNVVCFDVDDTLIVWDFDANDTRTIEINGYKVLPHFYHIECLKRSAARGHTVIVWSQGGYHWAADVVRQLGLVRYVSLTMCKPKWLYDDVKPNDWTKVFYTKNVDGERE